jgi:sulfur relay (sulfurtransferase) complex TusBCD TusD component (DsrE family)
MSAYLLIESLDPFESNDVKHYYELAADLEKRGDQVTLFLVQNGVLAARKCPHSEALRALAAAGVEVLADDFSLRERGIRAEHLTSTVKPAPLEVVLDQLAAGRKALWH